MMSAAAAADDSAGDPFVAFKAGRYEEALASFEADAERRPSRADVLANVGATLVRLGRNDEAKGVLEHALELGPAGRVEATIRYDLGNAQLALGRIDEAIESYRASLVLEPDDLQAKMNLEIALRRQRPSPPPPGSGGPTDDSDGAAPAPVASGGSPAPAAPNMGPRKISREEAEQLLDALGRRERLEFPRGSRRPTADPSAPDW